MGALDHFLNGLDAVLKASDRAKAQKAAERAAAARGRATGAAGAQKLARGSFDAMPADPSCCLAKRKVK